MCTTDPGATLLLGFVVVGIAGVLPLTLAWRAAHRPSRHARLWTAALCVVLAALTLAMRPTGDGPTYAPVREALMDAVGYGLTWVFGALALAWAILAWWKGGTWAARGALALSAVPLVVLLVWLGYSLFGPDICQEIMAPRG